MAPQKVGDKCSGAFIYLPGRPFPIALVRKTYCLARFLLPTTDSAVLIAIQHAFAPPVIVQPGHFSRPFYYTAQVFRFNPAHRNHSLTHTPTHVSLRGRYVRFQFFVCAFFCCSYYFFPFLAKRFFTECCSIPTRFHEGAVRKHPVNIYRASPVSS